MVTQPEIKLKSDAFDPICDTLEDGVLPRFKTFLAGSWYSGEDWSDVRSPIDLSVVAQVPVLSEKIASGAFAQVFQEGRAALREMPGTKRLDVYHRAADLMEEYTEDFAAVLTVNAGKTGAGALGEVRGQRWNG